MDWGLGKMKQNGRGASVRFVWGMEKKEGLILNFYVEKVDLF